MVNDRRDAEVIKKILYIPISVVVILFGITFSYQNKHNVDLNYYFDLHWNTPLAWILFWFFTVGVLVGVVVVFFRVLSLQRLLNQARKETRQAEQELANLRSLPIKDVV
ncbi:MAG TPA: DUF1049 domain-containing protein [Acidiferrobacteraceae bacterium]|nr:DUF1049 domain-containing protein [Acidiferrobacteraceae bacterium]HEX20182.1 DUF1049 domain-containing protein [Acidiferrobacteraceae bacterium]